MTQKFTLRYGISKSVFCDASIRQLAHCDMQLNPRYPSNEYISL